MQTIKRLFRVDRRDINYLRTTIESYDGMAVAAGRLYVSLESGRLLCYGKIVD